MRKVTWLICALALPGVAFADDVSTQTRCETQAKSVCAPSRQPALPRPRVLCFCRAALVSPKSSRARLRCRRSTAGETGLGGCGLWPLLSDAARPRIRWCVG